MNIEKLPSGSYRIRKTYKKKMYSIVVDHKPTQKEALILLSEKMQNTDSKGTTKTFEKCANDYIQSKSNILSPSTIGGYKKILRQIDEEFKAINVYDITPLDIQIEVNRYADGRSPKTVANFHGFISAVMSLARPNMNLTTTLPQKIKNEPYVPTEKEVKKILEESKGTDYHIMFQLGVLGLRRSEACCISSADVDGNYLTINKALVYDENNKLVEKHITKTTEGMRTIYIPDSLSKQIIERGDRFDKQPHNLVLELHRIQDRNGIPHFRFHDLRHFYASYAHSQGMSDADIMASGGWKSDYTMKRVYRHEMEEKKAKKQKMIANKLI